MSMFGWVAAIGAGIGAVAFDLGTSACSAVAGTMYGEHRTRKEDEKKIKRFQNKVNRELKILHEEISSNSNNNISPKAGVGNKEKEANQELMKKMQDSIDSFTQKIMSAGTDLFISEKQKMILKDATEKIKNIKTQFLDRNIITVDQVREIYNIFAKKNWLMEKFSPNIVRNDDFLIKEIMQEICKKDIGNQNKSLLELLSTSVVMRDQEMCEYQVFFDFLSKYSGVINNDISGAKWKAKDCVLVDEFIKDKEFNMYEDIEELPECCKRIDEIKKICEKNIPQDDDKNDYINRIDDILREKYKSLGKQLDEICKQDERLKGCNGELNDKIQEFKNKLNGNGQASKLKNEDNIIEVKKERRLLLLQKRS